MPDPKTTDDQTYQQGLSIGIPSDEEEEETKVEYDERGNDE